jgi:hypothetical protein
MTDVRIVKNENIVSESHSQPIRLALGQAGFGCICLAERTGEAVRLSRGLHPNEEPLIMVIPLMNDVLTGGTKDVR